MDNVIVNDLEFDKVKEKFCPQCYFEDDVQIIRSECKHNKNKSK